jgi:hypothetical protein
MFSKVLAYIRTIWRKFMSDKDNNVISLAEFKEKHPTPSGKIYRPKAKPKKSTFKPENKIATHSYTGKLGEAMRKYGDATGNVVSAKARKLKEEREELLKEYDLGDKDGNV